MSLRNERGQAIVEMVLIMALFLGVAAFVSNFMQEQRLLARLVSGPWNHLAGMMENGVWVPAEQSRHLHPNNFERHNTTAPNKELEPK